MRKKDHWRIRDGPSWDVGPAHVICVLLMAKALRPHYLFHTLMLNSFVHAALLQGTDADHLYGSQFAHYWTQMRAFAVPRER